MKPTTKLQHQVVKYSKRLPKVSNRLFKKSIENCFNDQFTKKYTSQVCLECGHKWKESQSKLAHSLIGVTCPNCNKELSFIDMRKTTKLIADYSAYVTTFKEFQVVRIFRVNKIVHKEKASSFSIHEVIQHWITSTGESEFLCRASNWMSYNVDEWVYHSPLEIRNVFSQRMTILANLAPSYIYDHVKVINEIKRRGFQGKFFDTPPQRFITSLLTRSEFETLLKANQSSLLETCIYNFEKVQKYWRTIRICMRNHYIVSDASLYWDYIGFLDYFNKDLLNAVFVCPENLKEAHDTYMLKKQRAQIRKRQKTTHIISRSEMMLLNPSLYLQEKRPYLDLSFNTRDIVIKPLQTIDDFRYEADHLSHCVYTSNYYSKRYSLVLSARKDGVPIETIEVDLCELKIIQARGFDNQPSQYHKEIVNVVNKNMCQIAERIKFQKRA